MDINNICSYLYNVSSRINQLELANCKCGIDDCFFCNSKRRDPTLNSITETINKLNLLHDSNSSKLLKGSSVTEHYSVFTTVLKLDHKGETILHKECRYGKHQEVSNALSKGVDFNIQDYAGWTPLHEAVNAKNIDIARLLLEYGALVNVPGLNYVTALHKAVQKNDISLVELLINYGADITARDDCGRTPMTICNNDEMRSALCLTPRLKNIFRVYAIPKLHIYFLNVSKEDINRVKQHPEVTIVNEKNFCAGGTATYVVLGDNNPDQKHLQLAMLQGALVVNINWLQCLINQSLTCPMDYLVSIPGLALEKAAKNMLQKSPKLFDKLQMYFCCKNTRVINGVKYSIDNLKHLVQLGGGQVIKRRPNQGRERLYPYHAHETECATIVCYLIYDEFKKEYEENLQEGIRYRSIKWLLECVNSFSIKPI